MPNKYTVDREIELSKTLKTISLAYEEISVSKMQRVRSLVLSSRDFLERLSEVFFEVKSSYKKELERLAKQKKSGHATLRATNGKTVSVLLSANTKFYGNIVTLVSNYFIEQIDKTQTDIVIVGRIGKDAFDARQSARFYTFFDIPDVNVTIENLKPLFQFILQYDKINIFFGKFENVIRQAPFVSSISGDEPLAGEKEASFEKVPYFFEPSLEKIVTLFEDEILVSFFKQVVTESELALHASRITTMEQALSNIEKKQRQLVREAARTRRFLGNKKQLESLSGISLWRK